MAIYVALEQLVSRHLYNKIVILSDSKAAIQAVGSGEIPISKNILDCRILLESLRIEGRQITLQWISGHDDIYGNEQADLLTKKGTQILRLPNTYNSFRSSKLYQKYDEVKYESIAHYSRICNVGELAWAEISRINPMKKLSRNLDLRWIMTVLRITFTVLVFLRVLTAHFVRKTDKYHLCLDARLCVKTPR
ncbi:RNase H domain-containing protein [Trichonephila inaurata madagascariensis]|uniref:RNase H domain-containing protein n=1 Tax=Trichonephila inaurata madagascariensis TaxID=2747483 RepID=A0A8X6XS45_9ARAC|nr:RNase H domain-containing protein [Trichonephila inaurata madagascariensis]